MITDEHPPGLALGGCLLCEPRSGGDEAGAGWCPRPATRPGLGLRFSLPTWPDRLLGRYAAREW